MADLAKDIIYTHTHMYIFEHTAKRDHGAQKDKTRDSLSS